MLVTGVGGTGVVTLSAVLGQAAHLEGKGFGSIDMTGLAQKGGAVACHMRVAKDGRPDPRHPRRRGRRRPGARLRPRGDRLQQGAGDHQARPHRGGVLRLRDVDRRLHAQRQPQGARRGAAARHRGAGRQGARAPLRCAHGGGEAVRRLHRRQHVPAGLRLSARPRADRLGGHRAGDRAQRRGRGDEPQRLPLRPAGGARPRGARAPDRRRPPPAPRQAADAGRASSPSAPTSSPTTRMRRWPSATARAWRASPRPSAARRRGAPGLAEAVARGYHKLLAYKDEYEVARLYAEPGLREGARRAVRGAPQARVPPGAAAAGAPRQGHRRAAQDALRRLDAARVPPAGQGQAPARHGAWTCSATRPSASSSGR